MTTVIKKYINKITINGLRRIRIKLIILKLKTNTQYYLSELINIANLLSHNYINRERKIDESLRDKANGLSEIVIQLKK